MRLRRAAPHELPHPPCDVSPLLLPGCHFAVEGELITPGLGGCPFGTRAPQEAGTRGRAAPAPKAGGRGKRGFSGLGRDPLSAGRASEAVLARVAAARDALLAEV